MKPTKKLTIGNTKKAAFILQIGRDEYKTSMATTGNNTRTAHSQEATAKELVEEMYREWQIKGGKPSKLRNNDSNCRVETMLTSHNTSQIKKRRCYNCGSEEHLRNKCPLLKHGNNKERSHGKGLHKFNGFCNFFGKKGHTEDQCWNKHPEKRKHKNKTGASVEQDIIFFVIEGSRREGVHDLVEESFELENVAQMEFPEIKKVAESSEGNNFGNNANKELELDFFAHS